MGKELTVTTWKARMMEQVETQEYENNKYL